MRSYIIKVFNAVRSDEGVDLLTYPGSKLAVEETEFEDTHLEDALELGDYIIGEGVCLAFENFVLDFIVSKLEIAITNVKAIH